MPEPISDEEQRYIDGAALVDLSDLGVVRRHVFTSNGRVWPKPLLYALIARLDASEAENERLREALLAIRNGLSTSSTMRKAVARAIDLADAALGSRRAAAALATQDTPNGPS